MTLYILILFTVTTHGIHLTSLVKPYSLLKVTQRSLRPHLWNQLPISFRISHPNYSSPSRRPSFEHAGLTCYKLLSPSVTFHFLLWTQDLPVQKIWFSILVCLCLPDCSQFTGLLAHRFYVLLLFFSVLVIPTCGRQSWPTLINFWLIDCFSQTSG